jgi:hypothetical protein
MYRLFYQILRDGGEGGIRTFTTSDALERSAKTLLLKPSMQQKPSVLE